MSPNGVTRPQWVNKFRLAVIILPCFITRSLTWFQIPLSVAGVRCIGFILSYQVTQEQPLTVELLSDLVKVSTVYVLNVHLKGSDWFKIQEWNMNWIVLEAPVAITETTKLVSYYLAMHLLLIQHANVPKLLDIPLSDNADIHLFLFFLTHQHFFLMLLM